MDAQLTTMAQQIAPHIEVWFFYITALIMIPFAYAVLFDKNVIRAGFLLIGVFGGVCSIFLLLQAQFLAMAQMMIYAVGITLVVVIALMLTNPHKDEYQPVAISAQQSPAALTAIILFVTMYMALRSESWGQSAVVPINQNDVIVIGEKLLKDYSLPFEFASILLLVAMIGSVMLAKADKKVLVDADEDSANMMDSERKEDVVKV
ncbi:MAG: NADH-quinone oxidoreductase subunit J [Candidatus Obscuribacterales bacterium]|nr:NADH-quinone oxidoreductase subunit J [Candidatus Obscuribacterales bacterium]